MNIVCFNEFSHKYTACKSYIVNIIPFLKLISIITDRYWVAQLKGLSRETHCRHKKKQGSMLNGDVLDIVSRRGISSGSTFEIFRLVSLAPANSLSYRSLARLSSPV